MLIILMTVLVTLTAASLPMWSKVIQRDKEEELIGHGWEYVEAIRVFQKRFGRLPIKLEELIKSQPRCIRHLYKDPMTGKAFLPIYLNQPILPPNGTRPGLQPGLGSGPSGSSGPFGASAPSGPSGPSGASGPFGPSGPDDGDTPKTTAGPITGVRSSSTKKSSLVFFGQETYDQWLFTIDMLRAPQSRTTQLSTRWLGRPFEYGTPPGVRPGLRPGTGFPSSTSPPPPPPPSSNPG
jgi:type II secretory pathway pseudopilin PulG